MFRALLFQRCLHTRVAKSTTTVAVVQLYVRYISKDCSVSMALALAADTGAGDDWLIRCPQCS